MRALVCADLFHIMPFLQLTWRESRDIEVCRTSNRVILFHMGLKGSLAL